MLRLKKIFSMVLMVTIILAMGSSAYASSDNSRMKYIFKEDDLKCIHSTTRMVLIEYDDLDLFHKATLEKVLNNGVSIMFYGNDISFDDVKDNIGDKSDFNMELSPNLANKITGLSVTLKGSKYQYSGVIDATDILVTNVNTGEKSRLSEIETRNSKTRVAKHSPLDFADDIYNEIVSETETLMPPSGADEIKGNWYYDLGDYGEMKAPVYCYYGGYVSGEYYWDLLTSMTANPNDGYCVVNFSTEIDLNKGNQKLVDWSDLPSKTDSISVSLGADSSGPSAGISYSTSTTGLDVDPSISYSDCTAEWDVNSRPFLLEQGNGVPVKIEPAVRVSNNKSKIKFTRYYYMDIEDVLWGTSYTTDNMYSIFTVSP